MWRRVTIKTPPAAQPLAPADLANRLVVEDVTEHVLIGEFLRAAVSEIDGPNGIGVAIMHQTWTLTLEQFAPIIDLPGWPVTGVAEIRYLDDAGAWQVVDPASYRLIEGVDPVTVMPAQGAAWPRVTAQPGAVQIDYTLGAVLPAEADQGLVTAAAMIAGHLYENREAVAIGVSAVEIPLGAQHMLRRYRRTWGQV